MNKKKIKQKTQEIKDAADEIEAEAEVADKEVQTSGDPVVEFYN